MAVAISLSTFNGHKLTAQDHALIIQTALSQSGIFYGVNVTLKDENTLHITTGEGVACGRVFRVTDMDYPVELSASGTLLGRLYVHIDTALQETPAQIMDVQGASLPALVQETDMNEGTGVYEIELATFTINELGISDLVYTAPKAQGGSGGDAIAPEYKATESYVSGQMFFYAGKLYKAIAAIPVGGPIVENTNVVETSLAAELFAVNQNLTNCLVWNPQDDYAYVNGRKTNVKCGLTSVGVYVDGHYVENCETGVMTQATWAPNVVAFTNDNTKLSGVVSTANTDSALKTVNQMYNINSKTLKINYYTDANVTVREAVVQNVVNGYVYVNAHKNGAGKLVLYAGANPSALTSLVDSNNLPFSGISIIQTNVNVTNNVYITKIEFVD